MMPFLPPPYPRRLRPRPRRPTVWLLLLLLLLLAAETATSTTTSTTWTISSSCGTYLAPSTIPGAGLGIFHAGPDLVVPDGSTTTTRVLPPDTVVPVMDYLFHNHLHPHHHVYRWYQYSWDSVTFEGLLEEAGEVHGGIMGPGPPMNCHFAHLNFQYQFYHTPAGRAASLGLPPGGVHPGSGASTVYHKVHGYATQTIVTGMELFVSYGENYFSLDKFKDVPTFRHYERGHAILQELAFLREYVLEPLAEEEEEEQENEEQRPSPPSPLVQDLYDLTRVLTRLWDTAVANVLPPDLELAQAIVELGFHDALVHQTVRSVDWLQQHGTCADHLRHGPSTLPYAGQGAFARRFIRQGEIVAPAPLIQFEHYSVLHMYRPRAGKKYYFPLHNDNDNQNDNDDDPRQVTDPPYHRQLLLNYCFGHPDTVILLCPLMSLALINHASRDQANVRLVWSDADQMAHPEWLQQAPDQWVYHDGSGLAWNVVATRDLEAGEEVLMDYGADWEHAWQQHVAQWWQNHNRTHTEEDEHWSLSCTPISAFDLNDYNGDLVLPTPLEGHDAFWHLPGQATEFCHVVPVPSQEFPELYCHVAFLEFAGLTLGDDDAEERYYACRVVDRYRPSSFSSSTSGGNGSSSNEPEDNAAAATPLWLYNVELFERIDLEEEDGEELFFLHSRLHPAFDWKDLDEDNNHHDDEDKAAAAARRRRRMFHHMREYCMEWYQGVLLGVSASVFHFVDRPYTRDWAQPWSFRHEIRIPDELLPEAWKINQITTTTATTTTTTTTTTAATTATTTTTTTATETTCTSIDPEEETIQAPETSSS